MKTKKWKRGIAAPARFQKQPLATRKKTRTSSGNKGNMKYSPEDNTYIPA